LKLSLCTGGFDGADAGSLGCVERTETLWSEWRAGGLASGEERGDMVAVLFALPVWTLWIGVPLLLFFAVQLLLSYLPPERAEPPDLSAEERPDTPAARWPRPVRLPKVTRRLILPRTDPYAPRPFVVYRRPPRRTRPVTAPIRASSRPLV
ncbi:MAG: hypothetical protein ACRDHE_02075, partial [Ktedonobacterales bacterium]